MGAAGTSSSGPNVEDVFSIDLYTGTGTNSNQTSITINNGIDLSGEGGLVWIKGRNNPGTNSNNSYYDSGPPSNVLSNSVNGTSKILSSNQTNAGINFGLGGANLNSSGFAVGYNGWTDHNYDGYTYCAWSFRKAPKFFDIVTYNGTGSAQTLSHSLGSVPGMILVKCTSADSTNWQVYHRGANGGTNPEQYRLELNQDGAEQDFATAWNDTAPTSTQFTIGISADTGGSGKSYVAYLFAHNNDDGGFGLNHSL